MIRFILIFLVFIVFGSAANSSILQICNGSKSYSKYPDSEFLEYSTTGLLIKILIEENRILLGSIGDDNFRREFNITSRSPSNNLNFVAQKATTFNSENFVPEIITLMGDQSQSNLIISQIFPGTFEIDTYVCTKL